MDKVKNFLSDFVVYTKYANYYKEEKRRQTWEECIGVLVGMHIEKYPELEDKIKQVFNEYVYTKKVLPSMRSVQFGGTPIEFAPNRMFNCAYTTIDDEFVFAEIMFLLLGGSGVGYSVRKRHINKLPPIIRPQGVRRFMVGDSIEGWSDSIRQLIYAYTRGKERPRFDYRDIRPAGSLIKKIGCMSSGYEALQKAHINIESVLIKAIGRKLKPLEVHDIICYIAESVVSGGVRSSALISLFDVDETNMILCKSDIKCTYVNVVGDYTDTDDFGKFVDIELLNQSDVYVSQKSFRVKISLKYGEWELNRLLNEKLVGWIHIHPQRTQANNSVSLRRGDTKKETFDSIWKMTKDSMSGEPGFYWTNDDDFGTNPCCLSGDSLLKTLNGYESLESLSGIDNINIINKNGESKNGKVWETGEKEVFTIKAGNTKSPFVINATHDHTFMLYDGSECNTDNLRGKRLMPHYIINNDYNDIHVKYGFLFGDGVFRKNQEKHSVCDICFTKTDDNDVKTLFGFDLDCQSPIKSGIKYEELENIGVNTTLPTYERILPDNITDNFLKGLFSANGTVKEMSRIALKTSSMNVAIGVQKKLNEIGIESVYITTNKAKKVKFSNGEYLCKESYDVNVCNLRDLITFAEKIGFIQEYKRASLEKLILNKAPFVYSVKSKGIEKVYDFNIQDDTHWGVINGIVTHNCEIALRPNQFCNLTTINVFDVTTQEELNNRVKAASFIGTLQAGYTDFHYLRTIWKETTELEALIGVSMTGIASGNVLNLDLNEAAELVKKENEETAKIIQINPAARTTCIKPEGSGTLAAGVVGSGIHAAHSTYYIRNNRINKNTAVYKYLKDIMPQFIEDDMSHPNTKAVVSMPIFSGDNMITRDESAIDFLSRIKQFSDNWIKTGHISGVNSHNVSATVSIRKDEWDDVAKWMWENKESYSGLSILPYDGGTYKQAPFIEIEKETYNIMFEDFPQHVDFSLIQETFEEADIKHASNNKACAAGGCEI
jgi:hypothetical protein